MPPSYSVPLQSLTIRRRSEMRVKWMPLAVMMLTLCGWMVTTVLNAQVRGADANVNMMDNCSEDDAGYNDFGGCPEGAPFPGSKSYTGDVSVAEFFALLFSPLAPGGQVIGHPSWRNEPSYLSIRAGQNLKVNNRGGRGAHVHRGSRLRRRLHPTAQWSASARARMRKSRRADLCALWRIADGDGAGARACTSFSAAFTPGCEARFGSNRPR